MHRSSDAVEQLARELRRHRQLYYNRTPEISDAEFDALEDRLRQLAPEHPALAEVGAPPPAQDATASVAVEAAALPDEPSALAAELRALEDQFYAGITQEQLRPLSRRYRAAWDRLAARAPGHPALAALLIPEGIEWTKARHEIPMGSLNKVNTEDELREWATRCDALAAASGLPPVSGDLAMTEKLDGLSLEVVYQDGAVDSAITRGDGIYGERITANVRRMQGVPERISRPGRISFRGEIVLKKEDAERLYQFRVATRGDDSEITLRNSASGLARANRPDMVAAMRFLTVYFYDLEGADGLTSEREKLELIRGEGFITPAVFFGTLDQVIERYRGYASGEREQLEYLIDGLVVRANHLDANELLGELNNRPRAAVAFKFENEMQVTKLKDIEWQTGDSGRLTPVGKFDPVRLAGAMVENASLHNVANLERLGIGIGDEVLVSRRNDVIPYIEKVVVKGPEVAKPPEVCGACQQPVTKDGEYLVCKNLDCPARRIGRVRTWIRMLDLTNWGDKTLELLFAKELVREPADLYRLTVEKLVTLDRIGETSARKLLDPLNAKRRLPLDVFIAALGVESVSIETARLLVRHGYDSVEAIAAAPVEELAALPGLGEIKAPKIKEGLAARVPEVQRLIDAGVTPFPPKEGGPLAGLSFCFSGSHSRPRKELEAIVEKNGGRIASSVTKGVSYLVLADPSSGSSKAQKAQKLGTELLDEQGFITLVSARGGEIV